MLTFKNVNIILILVLIIILLLKLENNISIYWFLLPGIIWLVFTTIGSFHIRWNYFLKANHKNRSILKKAVAISFDDGPNSEFTPKVLALLKAYKAKATFFCIGKHIEGNHDLLKDIVSEGHTLGNHSYSHDNNFGFFSENRLVKDIEKNRSAVKKIVNLNMIFFRPPFGVTNPNIAKAIKKLDLQVMGWSIRSYDTIANDPQKVYDKIIKNLKNGDIILLHDTSKLSISVLEKLLIYLKRKKIEAITLDNLLNMEAYGV